MAAFVCDICGGKLMAKSGGIFECEYCGMQYDKTRIQEMVQEIKGTVKVEGTVEVKGTVKLDGPVEVKGGVSAENYVKRGQLALASKNWSDAERFFEDALSLDAECVNAYLGKCCAAYKAREMSLIDAIIKLNGARLLENKDLKNALLFMAPSDAVKLREAIDAAEQRLQEQRKQRKQELDAFISTRNEVERIAREKAHQQKMVHLAATRDKIQKAAHLIAAGTNNLVALKTDGTLMVAGSGSDCRKCNVDRWEDVASVFTIWGAISGLTSDGTLLTTVDRLHDGRWRDLVAVFEIGMHLYGRKTDGTMISTDRKCDEDMWRDIDAVDNGMFHTVLLKKDGTVTTEWKEYDENDETDEENEFVDEDDFDDEDDELEEYDEVQNAAVSTRDQGQCDVSSWRDIVAIAAGDNHTVGLRADGTVVAVGENRYGQCNVDQWTDIVSISAASHYTVGLKADGTVVAVGSSSDEVEINRWNDMIAVSVSSYYTVGLKKDGTVLATGVYRHKIFHWKLFQQFDTLEQECIEAREQARITREQRKEKQEKARIAREKRKEEQRLAQEKQEEERRIAREKQETALRLAQQRRNAGICQHCGGELKGLFGKKCTSCGKPKDY